MVEQYPEMLLNMFYFIYLFVKLNANVLHTLQTP